MKKFIVLSIAMLSMFSINELSAASKAKKPLESVTYSADIHCATCAKKVMNVLPYEKGVKDVKVDQAKKTVVVKFDGSKTSKEQILEGFEKIKMEAEILKK